MPIFIEDVEVKSHIFSGGECHVDLNEHPAMFAEEVPGWVPVRAYLFSSNDIMLLLLTVDAMRRIKANIKIHLVIPYFPYARQDRVYNEGEALSVKVMADLINSLKCDSVEIWDAHSDVTTALIDNCVHMSMSDLIWKVELGEEILKKTLTLVSPDAGAEKKVRSLAKMLNLNTSLLQPICYESNTEGRPSLDGPRDAFERYKTEVIYCTKDRDTSTGEITGTKVPDDVEGKNLMIIDDICDGGRTFIELAEVLKEKGCGKLYLYVTHGIFSRGFAKLSQYFDHIYCYHLIDNEQVRECRSYDADFNNSYLTILGEK